MTLIHEKAPAVAFRQVGGLFIASFARPSFEAGQEAAHEGGHKPPRQENAKETPRKPQENTKEILVALLLTHPNLSVTALAAQTGSTPASVRHHLRKLQNDGRIRRVGPDKGGRWEVIEPQVKA